MSQILDQVSKTTIQLLLKEPFYGHFFTGILREVTERVPTAAVGMVHSQMVKLYINEDFWTKKLKFLPCASALLWIPSWAENRRLWQRRAARTRAAISPVVSPSS